MKKTITFLLYFSVFMISGCSKDFLNESNPNTLSEETFWQTPADVDRALAGCYSALQNNQMYNGSANYTTAGLIRLDIITDDSYANNQGIDGGAVARGEHSPTDGYVNGLWTGCYRLIARCNVFLENVDRVTSVPEASRNTMKAEVRFLRALAYQNLAMIFRDVPLITKTQTLAESKVPKNLNSEINAFIISELKDISSSADLPITATAVGRVEKGAALALLARQYLYVKDYPNAAATAKTVMDIPNRYDLKTPDSTLFKLAGESSKEIIFRVAYAGPSLGVGSGYAGYFSPAPPVGYVALPNLANEFYFKDGKPKSTSALYVPSNELTNRDPRFDATFLTSKSLFRGKPLTANNLVPTGYRVRKFTEETSIVNFDSGQDFYVIRYPEVLLTRAEALVESGSYTESEVDGLIDKVRARATMPTVEAVEGTNLSQAQLRAIIRHERRVELAFEGLRFYDLKRWGIYEQEAVTKYLAVDKAAIPGLQGRLLIGEVKHSVFPIPQRELDANNALVQADEWK
ncbi:RagB/SusD family nutrient uptake outer membrane protein [Pedobacter sp. SD-b]|uniref:RagB/SusD family nutrient uptake outer membrane protein n=1 Tax=Pedobacter segetis TaxID=2793069 RepID=A0ABS1BJJ4_9SPHI|nr:RagB/SusD family nutrient uptake outer membrane protein [Pedobacter segetis]MBK0383062.1 RagB/SusD family nutrient uptake outer membrane protein [Pedobacter segetis]